jgi:hypothetical protein
MKKTLTFIWQLVGIVFGIILLLYVLLGVFALFFGK